MMKTYRTEEIYGDFYENTGKPLVVILGGSKAGLPSPSNELMQYLTSNYNVLLLAYFGVQPLPMSLEKIPMEYFVNAIEYITNHYRIPLDKVAVIGQSKGGEAALLLTQYLESAATIALVASCYAFQGLPAKPDATSMLSHPQSSWSYRGHELPYIKFCMDESIMEDAKNRTFRRCYERSIEENMTLEAFIDLDSYKGFIFLISEEDDPYWPSKEMSDTLLNKHRQKANIEHVSLRLEGHYLLQYPESINHIIAYLNELFLSE